MPPNYANKQSFQQSLLTWFEQEGRAFPWRFNADAYAVLIAEKLLQQTLARDALVAAYSTILERYPDPQHLGQASVQDVEAIIRPLGFVYRAKELVTMAKELQERHNGQVPQEFKQLMALTGVGDYAARAVLSFAFGDDVAVVDTNVARFLFRLYGLPGPLPANPARKRQLVELASSLVPEGRSKDYNLAVLDLCAKICKLSNPRCPVCPLLAYCDYGSARASTAVGSQGSS